MQLGRPVTAFTSDGVPLEHGRRKAVGDVGISAYAIGVAEQARGRNHTAGQDRRDKTRRQVPALLLRVPTDRSLKKVSVPLGQEGVTFHPGANDPASFLVQLGHRLAGFVEHSLPVPGALALSNDLKASAQGGERILCLRPVTLPIEQVRGRDQGAAHRMVGVTLGDFFMAAGTRRVADVVDVGINVPVRTGIGPAGVGRLRRSGRRWNNPGGVAAARQPYC